MRLFSKAKRQLGKGMSGLHHDVKKITGGVRRGMKNVRHFGNSVAHKVENIPYVGKGLRSALEQEFTREREELGGRSARDIFHGARRTADHTDRLARDPSITQARITLDQAQEQGLPVQGLNERLQFLQSLGIRDT